MELETDHIPRALETITDVHSSVSFIVSEPSNARSPDRLEAERQALATLDHPNIAKVVDAGTTEAGRPFFFMERAQGTPLTEFCEVRQLAIAGRLALFRQICLAIAHAHEKGIVHRNLKPDSILIDWLDGRPVAKVVDFGLAKAVNAVAFTEHTLLSALGTMAGTPLYMAPEQAGPNARDADARADVYALGAILFELLTGTTPIQAETFKSATLGEILQAIRENRSPAPSELWRGPTRLQRLPATRRIELDEVGPFVRRELDRIAMKRNSEGSGSTVWPNAAQALARDLEQIPIQDGGARRTSTADRRSRMSVGRRDRRLISAGLVLAAAAIGAMSIRPPVRVQAGRAANASTGGAAQMRFMRMRRRETVYYCEQGFDRQIVVK